MTELIEFIGFITSIWFCITLSLDVLAVDVLESLDVLETEYLPSDKDTEPTE